MAIVNASIRAMKMAVFDEAIRSNRIAVEVDINLEPVRSGVAE